MSIATVKAAVRTLLTPGGTPIAGLQRVVTEYERVFPESRMPLAIVWQQGNALEKRIGAGGANGNGLKEVRWQIATLLASLGKATDTDGATFDALINTVVALYRLHINLDGAADVANVSKVQTFGETMTIRREHSIVLDARVLFQATVLTEVVELINA